MKNILVCPILIANKDFPSKSLIKQGTAWGRKSFFMKERSADSSDCGYHASRQLLCAFAILGKDGKGRRTSLTSGGFQGLP